MRVFSRHEASARETADVTNTPEPHFSTLRGAAASSFTAKPSIITFFDGLPAIESKISALNSNQYLILVVASDRDERNPVYAPIFADFAVHDRRDHAYGWTTSSEAAKRYDLADFPAVVILRPGHDPYVVKDRLAVDKEAAYFELPPSRQLNHVRRRFDDKDAGKRGSAVLAYGLTARDVTDQESLARAARELATMFADESPAVRDSAVYAVSLICQRLPETAKTALLRAVSPLFRDASSDVVFDAMALCRKTAESLNAGTAFSDVKAVTDALKTVFAASNPDLVSGAIITYAAFASIVSPEEIIATLPAIEIFFASKGNMPRWSALYAYGELFPRLDPALRGEAEDKILSFLHDPYSGIRHRVLLIVEANWDRFAEDRAAAAAPALRALFADQTQQIDVAELAIRLYVRLAPRIDAAERAQGREVLTLLRDDPEEYEPIRAAATGALEELTSAFPDG